MTTRPITHRTAAPAWLALAFVVAGCAGSGAGLDDKGNPILPTLIHGRITDKMLNPMGPGAMFIEWGKVHGGDFRWTTTVDTTGYFSRELPSAGLDLPEFGFHWYFQGYIYIFKDILLHNGEDNDVNFVLYENLTPDDLVGLPPLPSSPGGLVIPPLADDDLKDNPVAANPMVTPLGGGLIKVELDATSPKNNLSEQILVGAEWGNGSDTGVKMNAPGPAMNGNYPNGHYTVTLKVPDAAPDEVEFHFIVADQDCNNSPPMWKKFRVR